MHVCDIRPSLIEIFRLSLHFHPDSCGLLCLRFSVITTGCGELIVCDSGFVRSVSPTDSRECFVSFMYYHYTWGTVLSMCSLRKEITQQSSGNLAGHSKTLISFIWVLEVFSCHLEGKRFFLFKTKKQDLNLFSKLCCFFQTYQKISAWKHIFFYCSVCTKRTTI